MDLTNTIVPKSDQLNSDDLIAGPRTFTVTEVRVKPTTEQPVDIHLAESPGKPFRPSKTVLRILVTAWGKEGDEYVGRRMTLYRDAEVKWAGQEVGGIRVSALSHITKQIKLALTETRGKKVAHIVQPLADAPAPAQAAPTADELIEAAQNAGSNDELNRIARTAVASLGKSDLDAVKAIVTARRAELAEPTLPEGAGSVPTWGADDAAGDGR
jgi:hypothetical protein